MSDGTDTKTGPVTPRERIELVDILRGFALVGVLLFNITGFAGEQGREMWVGGIDRLIFPLRDFFVQAKFYSLFSFLFGWGMAVQLLRAEERGRGFARLYARRLLVLLGFGLAHSIFLWNGDILTIYALLGFLLLLFRGLPPRVLLVAAGLALLHAIVLQLPALEGLRGAFAELTAPLRELGIVAGYDSDSYVEITRRRWQELGRLPGLLFYSSGNVFAMFLLGLYAGKKRWFREQAAQRRRWRGLLLGGLLVGVVGNGLFVLLSYAPELAWVAWVPETYRRFLLVAGRTVGAPALMLFYVAALTGLMRWESWQQRLGPLAPVGRMALSNYLLQSLVFTFVFYGYGLGWYGRTGPTFNLLLAGLFFLLQVRLSAWWLARFRFGPAEWLWRTLSYGRRQPLRRSERPGALLSAGQKTALGLGVLALLALLAVQSRQAVEAGQEATHQAPVAVADGDSKLPPLTPTPIVPPVEPMEVAEGADVLRELPSVQPVAYRPSARLEAGEWQALVEAFDLEATQALLKQLAGPAYAGRAAGTAGGQAAGERIAGLFAQAGLQAAGSESSFFQPFPIRQQQLSGTPRLAVTGEAGQTDGYRLYREFAPALGGYMGTGVGEGPVVWANNCTRADFRQVPAEGSVVLCRGDWPRMEQARQALEHGATGLLLLAGPDGPPLDFNPVYQQVWVPPVRALPTFRITDAVAADLLAGSGLTVGDLSLTFEPFALATTARLEVESSGPPLCPDGLCQGRNVLGVLPGRDPAVASEVVIIGAHYDHLGQGPDGTLWAGANDNASGIAVLLELARSWQEQGYVPRRTVLFAAWDAEELGLLGSTYYVAHPSYPLTQTVGLINLDMVGAGGELLSIDGAGLAPQMQALAAGMGITSTLSSSGRSDHLPFLQAEVPASMLSWSGKQSLSTYHRPADMPEVIEPDKLLQTARIAGLTLLGLAETEPALAQLLAGRAGAIVQGDVAAFLESSTVERRAADRLWFGDVLALAPFTATLEATEVRLEGERAVATVRLALRYSEVAAGGTVVTRTLAAPLTVRFEAGPEGWLWAGPDLVSLEGREAAWLRVATPRNMAPGEAEAFARLFETEYAALAEQLGLPTGSGSSLLLYESSAALRADVGLSLPAGTKLWVGPGTLKLVASPELTRSESLSSALSQLLLANAGLEVGEMAWLWQGLGPQLSAGRNVSATQPLFLPALAESVAGEPVTPTVATAWAAVDYLRQQVGWQGLGQFIGVAGRQGEADALQAMLGVEPAGFQAAWQEAWRDDLRRAQQQLDRLLAARQEAVQQEDRRAFLDTVDGSVPLLEAEAERQFADLMAHSPLTYSLSAQPLAIYENGQVLAQVSLAYQPAEVAGQQAGGRFQQPQLFTPAGDALRWAGPPLERLEGAEGGIVLYPAGQEVLARELLDLAEQLAPQVAAFVGAGPGSQAPVIKLYPDWTALRLAVPLSQPVTEERDGQAAPGQALHLRLQPGQPAAAYRPVLLRLLAEQRLAELGVTEPWLLRGTAAYLAAVLGEGDLERRLEGQLHSLWLGLTNNRIGGLAELATAFGAADDHEQALALTQAWDAVRFLVDSQGPAALPALLEAQAAGQSMDQALQTAMGQTQAQFEAEWLASLALAHARPEWVEVAQGFDPERAYEHVDALTAAEMGGRRAGSPGAELAAAYIKEQFAAYGLEPLPLVTQPTTIRAATSVTDSTTVTTTAALSPAVTADKTLITELGYTQPFTIVYAARPAAPLLQIREPSEQQPLRLTYRQDFLELLAQLPVGGSAAGELVVVSDATYSGMDLAGKVVLRPDPGSPAAEMALALEHGAAGLLLEGTTDYDKELLQKAALPAVYPEGPARPLLVLTPAGMEQVWTLAGLEPAERLELPPALRLGLEVEMAVPLGQPLPVETANVVGLLPGSDPELRDKVIILGAHYDHVGDDPALLLCEGQPSADPALFTEEGCEWQAGLAYSGANDNASGVALLLELARLWQETGYRPARSVLFVAWGAQEPGQLGSAYFVNSSLFRPDQVAGVVVVDGVGGGAGYRLLAQGAWEQEGGLLFGLEMADDALEGHLTIKPPGAVPGQGDAAPFRAAGVPTLLLSWTDASEVNWPDALADEVRLERLAISGRMLALGVMSVLR